MAITVSPALFHSKIFSVFLVCLFMFSGLAVFSQAGTSKKVGIAFGGYYGFDTLEAAEKRNTV
jgi:lipopolysaccharide export LptBFGC system permease protein LptF